MGRARRDAFRLTGELLEVKIKPSLPIGESGVDAFGRSPVFNDEGDRLRGIANIGREDVHRRGLAPVIPACGCSVPRAIIWCSISPMPCPSPKWETG